MTIAVAAPPPGWEAGTCVCEACKRGRLEPHKIRPSRIHRYLYRPRNWKLLAARNDLSTYYLGVELETDVFAYRRAKAEDGRRLADWAAVTPMEAADLRRPKGLWIAKQDGSVSGPEFVSHPATLPYWHSKATQLNEMFTTLIHAGCRSHDNGRCGMHVNISKSAFDLPDSGPSAHLYRFMTLIALRPEWSLKVSQRTSEQVKHWARLSDIRPKANRLHIARGIIPNRYVPLNIPYGMHGGGRYEFRLPRGTLRLDRFYKNLEWTQSMVEYTRDARLRDCTPTRYMGWASEHRSEYPNLYNFLNEKHLLKGV